MTNSKNTFETKTQKVRDEIGENLKMQLTNHELSTIANLKKDNSNLKEQLKRLETSKKVAKFEADRDLKMEKGSPIFEKRAKVIKEATDGRLESLEEETKTNEEFIKVNEKEIKEAKENIKKIETGEKKILLNNLNEKSQEKIRKM